MREEHLPSRFSIGHRGPAKGAAYEEWREGICRGFCRLDVAPVGDDFIDCQNEFALLHSVAMATPKGVSARFARTRELLNDGCDDFVLISASHGTVRVTQKAQAIELEAGEMCLTEMNVIGEADLSSVGAFTTTRFSRRTLLQVSPNAENYLARPLGHGDGPTQLFNRYFVLCNELAGELDEGARQAAAQHLTDLAGLVVSAGAEKKDLARQRGFSQARLDLLKSDIVAMLGKHDLSIEAVAKVSGLGERQVQRLFAQDETTFSDFVLQQRLLMARRLLLQNPQRKISDIAFAAGFNDLSYFNRAFRRFFGATPSDVRALGTAE